MCSAKRRNDSHKELLLYCLASKRILSLILKNGDTNKAAHAISLAGE
jgi:hypothetical protein